MARLKLNNATNVKTLEVGVEEFISFCKVKKLSEKTIQNYNLWCKDLHHSSKLWEYNRLRTSHRAI
jgi:hypothetical protein